MTDIDTTKSSPVPAVDKSWNKLNFINLVAYIINSIATYSVQFGWIDRPDNGEISDKYQTVITPSGTTFLIWSVIFMWQLFWALWQLLPSQRNSEGVIRAWYYYPIFTIFQAGWTFSFSFEIMWLSLIFMYGILATLIAASMSLQKYKKTWKGYLLWQAPFSIQTGWIMAASSLNTNLMLVYYPTSTTAKIVVSSLSLVVLIATAFTWLSSYPVDFAIPLVLVWAFTGIYFELENPLQMIVDEFSQKQIDGIQNGVLAGAVLVGAGIVVKALYVLIKQRPAALKAEQESMKDEKSDSEVLEESV